MPPRHAYWTIIFGNQPTSFRAATREELLPTLKQIQSRHPDAIMMWFARGRLWRSEEEAREALFRRREERGPRREPRMPRPDDRRPDDRRPDDRRPDDRRPDDRRPDDRRPNPGDRKPPFGDRKPPFGDRKPPFGDRKPPFGDRKPASRPRPAGRGRDWRPGGEHKDPRDRFKVPRDVKRARFKSNLRRDRFRPGGPPPARRDRNGRPPKKKDEE